MHTQTAGYYCRNNVYYTKTCIPNKSSILVRNFTQVYILVLYLSFKIKKRNHLLSVCGNTERCEIIRGEIINCEECGDSLPNKRLLCNSCGKIVHKPRIIFGHSFICKE